MARYRGPSCRQCRREGQKLFLKGDRCYTGKCAIERRAYAPGQHGQARKKLSEYGTQLRAKQKAKRYYGVLESQFKKYFVMANHKTGITGENLLQILESRLDNVAYRLGLGNSRKQARQLVLHKHLTVNGKMVNIPSYLVKPGDSIAIREKSEKIAVFKELAEKKKVVPAWLDLEKSKLAAKVVSLPKRDEIDLEVEEHLIVELYSK